ncbi:MAG: GNAT family N-acetyltransferase [Candidatus Muirbacterium halophilum]|nr:GNAT family N-acetyltransferase [Candidatus Muirbacterium halophilum]MCK9476705.1 GNAT family N-acetyltransferase [Candidatus Muirbacterium halophilum]
MKFRYTVKKDDGDKIHNIICSSGFFREDEIDIAKELAEETYEKGQKEGYSFVFLEDKEHLAGYTCYGEIPCTIGSYDLYWIAVDNSKRNSGIGKKLLLETERMIAKKNGRKIYIETSNKELYKPTQQFYINNGYKVEVILKDFYNINDDKIIYSKEVSVLDIDKTKQL